MEDFLFLTELALTHEVIVPEQIKLVVYYRLRTREHNCFLFCAPEPNLYKRPWACCLAFSISLYTGAFIELFCCPSFFSGGIFPCIYPDITDHINYYRYFNIHLRAFL